MTTTALFATYLHHTTRLCDCGWGQQLTGRQRKYIDDTHGKRAQRHRAAV
jgi:hypothetical protein